MTQSFLTFDTLDITLKCAIHWKAVEFFTQFVILENLLILEVALSRAKGLKRCTGS